MGGMRTQPICFDRDEDAVVPHVVPGPHADPWHEPAMGDETILYLTDPTYNGGSCLTGPYGEPGAEPPIDVTWVRDPNGRRFERDGSDWVHTDAEGDRIVRPWALLLAEVGMVTAPAFPDEETP